MQYRKIGRNIDEELSILGFGLMRLPTINHNPGKIDYEKTEEMFCAAFDGGVNYFDTAYPYHKGQSEVFLGDMIKKYQNRDKINIATKLPPWAIKEKADIDRVFIEQRGKLKTDYIDFYLLHAMNKTHWENLKKMGILEWGEKKKKDGEIRYFGFSFHDDYDSFKQIINDYDGWDFCQIQYNYMDQDSQATTKGLELAHEKNIGVIIMEPLLGGCLSTPPSQIQELWDKAEQKRSATEWALLWLWNKKEVGIVLSGMSELSHIKENLQIADNARTGLFSHKEQALIDKVKNRYPEIRPIMCTACGYCIPCPQEIEIPRIFEIYNEAKIYQQPGRSKWFYNSGRKGKPNGADCVQCGECESKCPQGLKIMELLEKVHKELAET